MDKLHQSTKQLINNDSNKKNLDRKNNLIS